MQIQWFGQSCFKLQTKYQDQDITIITDPVGEKYGIKMGKHHADIVTISHQQDDHNNLDVIKDDPFVIDHPGEYETKGIFVYGIPGYHDDKQGAERGLNTMYYIKAEEMHILHLGDIGHTLTDDQLDRISKVDILFIPVGGTYTVNADKAIEIIGQLEPRIVIPMHYDIPGLKLSNPIDPVEKFIKASGLPAEKMDKFKIAKKDLPQDTTRLIVLEP